MSCSKCRTKQRSYFTPAQVEAVGTDISVPTATIQFRQDVLLIVNGLNTLYRASAIADLPYPIIRQLKQAGNYVIFLSEDQRKAYNDYYG